MRCRVGAQFLYGSASGEPRRLIELAGLTDLAVGNARGTPGGFEIVARERRLIGMSPTIVFLKTEVDERITQREPQLMAGAQRNSRALPVAITT